MNHHVRRQPDDQGVRCPCCNQPWPDDDNALERLIRRNIDRVSLAEIARAFGCSLSTAERVAKRIRKQPEAAQ